MEAGRFDTLTRFIGSRTSRRVAVGLAATGLVARPGPDVDAAQCSKKKPCPECRRCKKHKCKPDDGVACSGGGTCLGGVCGCGSGKFTCPEVALCCDQEQACLAESCGACPESPDPCTSAPQCGFTNPNLPEPRCFCVTSVDGVTTCTSVFADIANQGGNCTTDDDCTGVIGVGVEAVCVNFPCADVGFDNVCLNKGCVDLSGPFVTSRTGTSAPGLRQLKLRSAK
jgi:hypothetical protein